MKKVIIALFLIVGCLTFSKAQTNLNDFKYVIVPNKFDFLKEADKYQLNSLTKFLFNKYGFNAIMDNEHFPQDLANNRCFALKANIVDESGLLKTKLIVILKDCNNEIIFTSRVGETKEKEYKKAYNFALRDAFKSFKTVSYNYEPNDNVVVKSSRSSAVTIQEIEKLKEEIQTLKEEKSSNKKSPTKVEDKKIEIVEEAEEIVEAIVVPEIKNVNTVKTPNVLYAQEIDNGFQVVDSKPKVIMVLLTTPKQDTFIVKGRDAIVYKEDGFWYLSENNGSKTTTETLNIKF